MLLELERFDVVERCERGVGVGEYVRAVLGRVMMMMVMVVTMMVSTASTAHNAAPAYAPATAAAHAHAARRHVELVEDALHDCRRRCGRLLTK